MAMQAENRKVMILGAGVYQVPLIHRAKAMGLKSIVLSVPGNYPGIELADEFLAIDTKDTGNILAAAETQGIDGIATTGTDVCLPSLGAVVDALGLPGPGRESTFRSMDKCAMKAAFVSNGVATAKFETVRDYAACQAAVARIGIPVMIKAADSSGSRGITKVNSESELAAAWRYATEISRSGDIIVEEYLDGSEFGAQAIVHGDEVVAVFVHRDLVTPPPHCTPVGHSMPSEHPQEVVDAIEHLVADAVNSLGIRDCIANVDLMMVDGEPKIIEIGARMGATCLPECISIYAGFDVYEHAIRLALGEHPILPAAAGRSCAALLLRSDRAGVIDRVEVPESVSEHPNLYELVIDKNAGDSVNAFRVGPDRIGHIVVTADDVDTAEKLAEDLASKIVIRLKDAT